jgi:cold shock protein
MATGVVKFFEDTRGFGFIAPDDGGGDVYVHASQITHGEPGSRSLDAGARVEYEIGLGRTGIAAQNVSVL